MPRPYGAFLSATAAAYGSPRARHTTAADVRPKPSSQTVPLCVCVQRVAGARHTRIQLHHVLWAFSVVVTPGHCCVLDKVCLCYRIGAEV